MNLVEVKNKKQEREFINFRKRLYKNHSKFEKKSILNITQSKIWRTVAFISNNF